MPGVAVEVLAKHQAEIDVVLSSVQDKVSHLHHGEAQVEPELSCFYFQRYLSPSGLPVSQPTSSEANSPIWSSKQTKRKNSVSVDKELRKIQIRENQVMANLNINPPRSKIAKRQATCDINYITEAMELTALEELNKAGYEEGITNCTHCSKEKQHDKNAKFKTCTCCDKLRSALLVPVPNANSNLEALITELCGADTEITFAEIKDQFLEENYPNIHEGMHIHPDIFVTDQKNHGFPDPGEETSEDKGSINELKVRDFFKGGI